MDSSDTNRKDEYMLTTIDNPYDPYTQFSFWYGFDISKRIIPQFSETFPIATNCCEYLANEAITSDDFTDEENAIEMQRAIDEIIKLDPYHIYTRAYPDKEKISKVDALYES